MKKAFVVFAVMLLSAIISCGGGGGGEAGSPPAPTEPAISSLSTNLATPMKKLTISGARFNTTAALTVSFFNNDGFKLDVPVSEATSTSIIVAVPPYISPSTGKFGEGTVDIRVIQNSAGSIVTSNTISGFKIGSLPTLTLTPGEVTANFAGFLELALTDTENKLLELDTSSGGTINTVDLRAKLESIRLQYGQLKSKIRNAIANPGQAETIGEINGVPVKLDQESLRIADQLMVAVVDGTLAQLNVAPSPTNARILAAQVSGPCDANPELCSNFGEPLITVKNYHTGEITAVTQYNYAMSFPGASEVLGKMLKWYAATTATIGAGLAICGVGIPVMASAGITQVAVTGMSAKTMIDASRLSADSTDKQAAKDLLDDFNSTLEYMRDSVLSPTIGYISKKAGIIYDLLIGWKPIVEEKIPVFITQVKTFIDKVVPPTCTFFTYSAWSACQPGNTQTRTIISSSPAGCTGGNPILSQSCTYTPPSCTYAISPQSKPFIYSGGSGTVSITAQDGCTWTAASGTAWVSVTSGSSGTGNGTVGYSVQANISTIQRDGVIIIGGNTFSITQAGSIAQEGAFDGNWTGSYSGTFTYASGSTWNPDREPLSLAIMGNAIYAFSSSLGVVGTIDGYGNATWQPPANSSFTPYIYRGTFISTGTASGTWTLTIPGTGAQSGTGSGTWNATRQ